MDKIKEVRKSVVRISFKWMVEKKKEDGTIAMCSEPMVVPGVIASINDDGCLIITTSEFFYESQFPEEFEVNFPNENGYGVGKKVLTNSLTIGRDFTRFVVWLKDAAFLKQIKFDTRVLETSDEVFVFIFPRESYITPTGYARGRIVFANPGSKLGIYFQNSQFHEYGHFGAPVFNESGNFVGMCFSSQLRTHVWTVDYLKRNVLDGLTRNISYVEA